MKMKMNWFANCYRQPQAWVATSLFFFPIAIGGGIAMWKTVQGQDGEVAQTGPSDPSVSGPSLTNFAPLTTTIGPTSNLNRSDASQARLDVIPPLSSNEPAPANRTSARTTRNQNTNVSGWTVDFSGDDAAPSDPAVAWLSPRPPQNPMPPAAASSPAAVYYTTQSAQFPGQMMNNGFSVTRRGPVDHEDEKLNEETRRMMNQLRSLSKNDEAEAKELREKLREIVTKQFKLRQEHRKKELEQLKKQVTDLEKNLEERDKKEAEIIDRRLAELQGQRDPMSWDYQANGQAFGRYDSGFGFVPGTIAGQGIPPNFQSFPGANSYPAVASPPQVPVTVTQPMNPAGPPASYAPTPNSGPRPAAMPRVNNSRETQDPARSMENRIKELESTIRDLEKQKERLDKRNNETTPAVPTY